MLNRPARVHFMRWPPVKNSLTVPDILIIEFWHVKRSPKETFVIENTSGEDYHSCCINHYSFYFNHFSFNYSASGKKYDGWEKRRDHALNRDCMEYLAYFSCKGANRLDLP